MDLTFLFYLFISFLPIIELRGGMPLAVNHAIQNNIPVSLAFSLVVLVNIFAIFFVFFFLDKLNNLFLKNKFYKNFFDFYVEKMQKKVDKFEKQYSAFGFLALAIFVAIPLPGTGAWTGTFVAWILGLDRKKSILSISAGVLAAGVLVLLATLGFLSLL